MEPKERILEHVNAEGKDANGNNKLQFQVVNIGETVEGLHLD